MISLFGIYNKMSGLTTSWARIGNFDPGRITNKAGICHAISFFFATFYLQQPCKRNPCRPGSTSCRNLPTASLSNSKLQREIFLSWLTAAGHRLHATGFSCCIKNNWYNNTVIYRVAPTRSYEGGKIVQFGISNDSAANYGAMHL